jgi:hypothetical protein
MENKQDNTVNCEESGSKKEDVFADSVPMSSEEVEVISHYADGVIVEEVVSADDVYTSSSSEKLTPTFVVSSPLPFVVGPKGQSKTNQGKGKRPRFYNSNKVTLDDIDGDLLLGLETSKQNSLKHLYRLARESQRSEKLRRAKNTMLVRIEEMNEKKLVTLSECVQIFMSECIPISLSIPTLLTDNALSDILKVDPESSFIKIMSDSRDMQEIMRRAILEAKNLSVCCCGYVYVHPTLTYARHPTDTNLLVGKQPYTEKLSVIKRSEVIKNLNSLRYYLEILYEYYNT